METSKTQNSTRTSESGLKNRCDLSYIFKCFYRGCPFARNHGKSTENVNISNKYMTRSTLEFSRLFSSNLKVIYTLHPSTMGEVSGEACMHAKLISTSSTYRGGSCVHIYSFKLNRVRLKMNIPTSCPARRP